MGLVMFKKEVEIRAFRKAFKLPDVVDLDRIKARYDEKQSTLTITMRKKLRGILGLEIEEVKDEAETSMTETIDNKETDQGSEVIQEEIPEDKLVEEERHDEQPKAESRNEISKVLPTEPEDEITKPKEMEDVEDNEEPQAIQKPSEEGTSEEIAASPIEELKVRRDDEQPQSNTLASTQEVPGEEYHDQLEEVPDITEPRTDEKKQEADLETQKQTEEEMEEIRNRIGNTDPSLEPHKENETNQGLPARAEEIQGSSEKKKKKSKLCPPFWFAGSALLVSLIVIVIHMIRAKRD